MFLNNKSHNYKCHVKNIIGNPLLCCIVGCLYCLDCLYAF